MLLIKWLFSSPHHPSQQSLCFTMLFKERDSRDDQCTPGVWRGLGCCLWNCLSSPRNVFGIYRAESDCLQAWARDVEDPSPGPSPLGVGHSQILNSWPFGPECRELGLTHLPSISLGKKDPRGAACIHPSDISHPSISGAVSLHWSQQLTGALHSNAPYMRPDIPDPPYSDFHPSLWNRQELQPEEEVAVAASPHKFWLGVFLANIIFPPLKARDLYQSLMNLLKAELVRWKLWRQVHLIINISSGIYL